MLKDPSEEEQEAIIKIGIDYITKSFGGNAASFILEVFKNSQEKELNKTREDLTDTNDNNEKDPKDTKKETIH